jgi:hypothetical protein
LNTVPEKSDQTRFEQYQEEGKVIAWPELRCSYLADILFEIGPCLHGGMGLSPLTWQEINAWQETSGIRLAMWEATAIRRASKEYARQVSISDKPDCPAPGKVVEQEPEKLAKHIRSILRS